jgi:methylated-DNA-[protein]-cysteine S-methyltransferase
MNDAADTSIRYRHDSPLGPLTSCWTAAGLYCLTTDDCAGEAVRPVAGAARELDTQLSNYFETGRADFETLELDHSGWTDFRRRIYDACRQIPPGTTVTYKELARRAGNAAASRAVGSAMACNRLLLVIPCHRVVGSDGKLHGFSARGGIETKRYLLELERP